MQPIAIRGARVHNLKGVDCDLPRNSLVVITGPSGSGKSSLAFDTLYAEGQRRYVESLSAYARQFLDQLEKPDVESVTGLSPAIAIEQRTTSSHPRSTVGTVTEVYDHLRVLFAGVGRPHCPRCGEPVAARSRGGDRRRHPRHRRGRRRCRCWRRWRGGARAPSARSWPRCAPRGYHRVRVDGGCVRPRRGGAARPPPQPSHRGARGSPGRCAPRPAAGSWPASSGRSSSPRAWCWSTIAGEERLYSRSWPARGATSRWPTSRRARSRSTAPTAPVRTARGSGWRWRVDAEKVIPDPQRPLGDGAIHPWQPTARRRCGRPSRTWPRATASPSISRSPRCRGPAGARC